MQKKEEKEEDLLKDLCGDDAKLYDFLARTLYLNPIAAISPKDLEILIEEAETSFKDVNYNAILKYRAVLDKAIFEATQNPEKRGRYIKVIQDLTSKRALGDSSPKKACMHVVFDLIFLLLSFF